MRFDWDPDKARANLRKHGVSFETSKRVWDDAARDFDFDQVVDGEDRWRMTGRAGAERLLVVAYVEIDDDLVRIISARDATPSERRHHEG